jgi:hypothetical protein
MRFILKVVIFTFLLVIPFLLVLDPIEKLGILTWLTLPTWQMQGEVTADNLFSLSTPMYTFVLSVSLAVLSSFSKVLFIALMVLTVLTSILSVFWLNYLLNAAQVGAY